MDRPHPGAKIRAARESLAQCRLCAFQCAADRTSGPAGVCASDATPRLFHEGIEWAGEEGLVPTYTVSLSGCNMACSFCLTGGPSQNGQAGIPLVPEALGARISAQRPLLQSVTILGGEPAIHLDGALEIAARLPADLSLVWKTNAYASRQALSILEGVPDVVLADYKFGNDDCAARLARVPRYTEVVRSNLLWAAGTSRLVVRHLVMPGHLDCCLVGVADWLSRELPGTPLSLMTGYLPVFRAGGNPVLGRTNRPEERRRAWELVRARNLALVPWTIAPGPSRRTPPADEVWIDPSGRICVDSASAGLAAALKRLGSEFVLDASRAWP
jgi:putative pyruvate formate lyase activating enzyme